MPAPALSCPSFVWFIADTHLGHGRMFEYEPVRQTWGATPDDVDRAMVEAWNRAVQPGDCVLHLGDFSFGSPDQFAAFRGLLHGRIALLRGNHDRGPRAAVAAGFTMFQHLEWDDPLMGRVVARHDPAKFTADEVERAAVLLCGHLHSAAHRSAPDAMAKKLWCLSVEVLPTAPSPLSLSGLQTMVLDRRQQKEIQCPV
jgi:calcineurin-like phosphoesterase family protein